MRVVLRRKMIDRWSEIMMLNQNLMHSRLEMLIVILLYRIIHGLWRITILLQTWADMWQAASMCKSTRRRRTITCSEDTDVAFEKNKLSQRNPNKAHKLLFLLYCHDSPLSSSSFKDTESPYDSLIVFNILRFPCFDLTLPSRCER